jgi:hypothetical protein
MRLSEIRGLDPVNQSAADAVASLPVFDDLRRATIAAGPVENFRPEPSVRLRDHSRARRPLVLSALAAAVGILLLLTLPAGGGQAKDRLAAYFEAGVNVPGTTLAAVGLPASVSSPTKVTTVASTAASGGAVVYVGAEFCPYCALQRWALLVALSKFGTFTNLSNAVYSSSTDIYPHLASWTFVGARYSSPYFRFEPTELSSSVPDREGGYKRLQTMTAAQQAAYHAFDPQQGLPFVDIGDQYVTVGASASPAALEGLSLEQIGSRLDNPVSPVAQAVDGSANYLIAAMCQLVHGTGPAICSSATTSAALGAMSTSNTPPSPTPSAIYQLALAEVSNGMSPPKLEPTPFERRLLAVHPLTYAIYRSALSAMGVCAERAMPGLKVTFGTNQLYPYLKDVEVSAGPPPKRSSPLPRASTTTGTGRGLATTIHQMDATVAQCESEYSAQVEATWTLQNQHAG